MNREIEADIQEVDLTESVKYLYRITTQLLDADNLTVLQKANVESIKTIFGLVLNTVVYHAALEEICRKIFADAKTDEERLRAIDKFFADLKDQI